MSPKYTLVTLLTEFITCVHGEEFLKANIYIKVVWNYGGMCDSRSSGNVKLETKSPGEILLSAGFKNTRIFK